MFFFVLTRRGPRKTQKGVKHFYLITRAFVLGFKLLPRHVFEKMSCVIPFGELVPDANVRFVRIDGQYYMSIRDLIMVFCETDNNYAGQIWRRMSDGQKSEVSEDLFKYQFSGAGQKNQDVITLKGALKLIMWLPSKAAASRRSVMADIISRYLTGDLSLNQEIIDNKNMGSKKSYLKFMNTVEQDIKRKHDEMMEEIPATSYIYATHSPAFPGLVKIGRSRDVKARLSSANTFAAAAPFVLIAMAPTFDAIRDEKEAHDHFSAVRQEGEFFEMTHQEAKKYLSAVIKARHEQELEEFSSGMKGSLVFV